MSALTDPNRNYQMYTGDSKDSPDAEVVRLRALNEELLDALYDIAEFCNGYGDVAGIACKKAREAIAKAA